MTITTPIKSRRGLSILSDLVWVLVFIIGAFILYVLLYKPLLDEKYDHAITTDRLVTDAQYIALTLPRLQASGGTTTGSPGLFSDAVQEISLARKRLDSNSDFKNFVAGSSYSATLDSTFAPSSAFWAPDPEQRHRIRIAVLLNMNGKDSSETCREYSADAISSNYLCENILSKAVYIAPAGSKKDATAFLNEEIGTAYIPTTDTPVTVKVYVQWSGP